VLPRGHGSVFFVRGCCEHLRVACVFGLFVGFVFVIFVCVCYVALCCVVYPTSVSAEEWEGARHNEYSNSNKTLTPASRQQTIECK